MSGDQFRGLTDLYPTALRRHGMAYPVTVEPWSGGALEPPAIVEPAAPSGVPLVRDDAYLEARRDADPRLHDGPTLNWLSDGPGRVRVEPGGYFDMLATCGALRAEAAHSTDWADPGQNPLRHAVHRAVGDPLRSGAARCAAVGVSVVLTVPHEGGRAVMIGRRPGGTGPFGGHWHVAPSGMLEADGAGAPVTATALLELSEELGITLTRTAVRDRLTVLGLAQDLTMLRPDIVVHLDLAAHEVPADLRPASEFTDLTLVPLTPAALAGFWGGHPPSLLVPPAAGAIALAEPLAQT